MRVRFWGVRGSIPIPGQATVRYGGNTSCLEVQGAQGECIVLEAGTGLRVLGLDLMGRTQPLPEINIFISHTHWDHIQGFPFFVPCYIPGTRVNVRGPVHFLEDKTLADVFTAQMAHEFFPVSNAQMGATITYENLSETRLQVGGITIETQFTNHPIRSLGYRISEQGRSLVYTGDHEPYYNLFGEDGSQAGDDDDDLLFGDVDTTVDAANERFVTFARGADLFIVDCQYTPDEYPSVKRTWGHSSWDYCLDWMKRSGAGRMILTHHDPLRTDNQLDGIAEQIACRARELALASENILLAREGMEVSV